MKIHSSIAVHNHLLQIWISKLPANYSLFYLQLKRWTISKQFHPFPDYMQKKYINSVQFSPDNISRHLIFVVQLLKFNYLDQTDESDMQICLEKQMTILHIYIYNQYITMEFSITVHILEIVLMLKTTLTEASITTVSDNRLRQFHARQQEELLYIAIQSRRCLFWTVVVLEI